LLLSHDLVSTLRPPPSLSSFPTRRSSDLHLPHRDFHGLPTTPSRHGALPWTDEGAGGTVAQFAGPDQRSVRHGHAFFGDRRFSADRKSTRLNSSHQIISYAVFCLKKKKQN